MSSRPGTSARHHRPRARTLHLAAGAVVAVALAGCSADLDSDTSSAPAADPLALVDSVSTGSTGADSETVSYLWVQAASAGTLRPDDAGDGYVLTLEGVPEHLTRFTDRPERAAAVVAPEDTARRWSEFFQTSAPNATLSYAVDGSDVPQLLVLTLGQPVYDPDAATMAYPAQLVDVAADELPDATRSIDIPEIVVPEEFGAASLFIDGASPCWKAASGQPLNCSGANLSGITVPSGSSHLGSSFAGANLSGATFAGVDLGGANFASANLDGADFSGADLRGSSFAYAGWNSMDVTNANLSGAAFICTHGEFANLDRTGTNVTGTAIDYWQGVLMGLPEGRDPGTGLIVYPEVASEHCSPSL